MWLILPVELTNAYSPSKQQTMDLTDLVFFAVAFAWYGTRI